MDIEKLKEGYDVGIHKYKPAGCTKFQNSDLNQDIESMSKQFYETCLTQQQETEETTMDHWSKR